jgi:predicted nucleic acid-binding protein
VAFVVLYDANVLYPALLRNILILIAQRGIVQAKWTSQILDETFSNLRKNRPDLNTEKLDRTRALVERSVRDANVTGYEELIDHITLPDPDDRHVLAAAIKSHAQVIVTFNQKDFPPEVLDRYQIEVKHPDDFLVDQFYLDAIALHQIIQGISDSTSKPHLTQDEILDSLARSRLMRTVGLLRR